MFVPIALIRPRLYPLEKHPAAIRPDEAEQHHRDRALAAARLAKQGDGFRTPYLETDTSDSRNDPLLVGQAPITIPAGGP